MISKTKWGEKRNYMITGQITLFKSVMDSPTYIIGRFLLMLSSQHA